MVRVHLDPPEKLPREPIIGALAQLVERLLCKQDVVGSTPSGSTIRRLDRTAVGAVPSSRTQRSSDRIYIVQRDNQRCRPYPSGGADRAIFGLRENGGVVQVKYTNQVSDLSRSDLRHCAGAPRGKSRRE